MKILKVSSKSNPNAIATVLIELIKEYKKAEIHTIGAGALNQAIKAIAIARDCLLFSHINLICIPIFLDLQTESGKCTAIKLIVEPK